MLFHLVIGVCAAVGYFYLRDFAKKKGVDVSLWQWVLTIACLFYGVFVLEIIYGFLGEGASQAAMVNGFITGLVGVVWAVLLARFVFFKKA